MLSTDNIYVFAFSLTMYWQEKMLLKYFQSVVHCWRIEKGFGSTFVCQYKVEKKLVAGTLPFFFIECKIFKLK